MPFPIIKVNNANLEVTLGNIVEVQIEIIRIKEDVKWIKS